MVEGAEASQWRQTAALCATVNNIFANKDERTDVTKFVPPHLNQADRPKPEPTPEEVSQAWDKLLAKIPKGTSPNG